MSGLKAYYQIPFACIDCSIRQVQMRCILNSDFGDWKFWDRRKQVWPMGRSKLENRGLLMELSRKSNCNPEFLKYLLISRAYSAKNCMCNVETFQNSLPSVPLSEYKCGYMANYDWFPQYVQYHLHKNSCDAEKPKIFEKIDRDWLNKLYELYNSTVGISPDDELENLVKELQQRYLNFLYLKQLYNANKNKEIEDNDSEIHREAEETEQKEEKKQIRISLIQRRISLNHRRMSKRLSQRNARRASEQIFDSRHNIKDTTTGLMLPPMFGRRAPGTPPTRQSIRAPSQSALSSTDITPEMFQQKQTKRKSQRLSTVSGNRSRQSLKTKLLMALLKTGSSPQLSHSKLGKNRQNDDGGFNLPDRRSTVRFYRDSGSFTDWRRASNEQVNQGSQSLHSFFDEKIDKTKSTNKAVNRPERKYDRMRASDFIPFNAHKMIKRKLIKEQPDTQNAGRVPIKFGRSNISRLSSVRNSTAPSRSIRNFLEDGYDILNKIPLDKKSK